MGKFETSINKRERKGKPTIQFSLKLHDFNRLQAQAVKSNITMATLCRNMAFHCLKDLEGGADNTLPTGL